MNPQRITPRTIREGFTPVSLSTMSAIRLSSPVFIMAAARKSAAPTRQNAGDENPASAVFIPADVPMIAPGAPGFGEKPTSTATSAMMMPPDTGYETEVVAQTITAKTMTPIILCPATESPGCSGRRQMIASAMKAMMSP